MFYESIEDLPPFDDYQMAGHTYRYFQGQALFPCAYDNLRLSGQIIGVHETLTISVEVSNAETQAGDEVVQLYVRDIAASVPRPLKELKGVQRIHLATGETKSLTFVLAAHQLGFYDEDLYGEVLNWIIEPG